MSRQALGLWLIAAVALGAAAAVPAFAQTTPPTARLLDVPYLPQSEDLCGGAAAAMVMRYWGVRDLYADAFQPLVDHSAGGIRTDRLTHALAARGWTTLVESGGMDRLREQLAEGRPAIVLIEDRPGRFHYVVAIAAAEGRVIVQDPARAPLRTLDEAAFLRAWDKSDRWMLVLLPPKGLAASPAAADLPAPPPPPSCAALVGEGVAAAKAGDRVAAAERLRRAERACPQSSAPPRELAGLEATANNWDAAAADAERAVANDPSDQYAWNLLATARYVGHDDLGALAAWNHAGQPRVDILSVQGLARTRYRIASEAAGLEPRTVLTPGALRLAERRLRDVPAFAAARLTYRPGPDGRAQVEAAVVERDLIPRGWPALLAAGIEAGVNRTIGGSVSSATGGGERLTASWRWWDRRKGAWLSFAAPAPRALGGTWRVDASRETQAFGTGAFEQTRSHAGLAFGTWLTARARVEANAGVDGWTDRGRTGGIGIAAQFWPAMDRLVVDLDASAWPGAQGFARGDASVRWRSTSATAGSVWLARASLQHVTSGAPEFVWPGADVGHAREALLRAHPLLHDGIITGGVFGRQLTAGGLEWRHWSRPSRWLVRVGPAVFADAARAADGLASTDARTHVDLGAGIRVSVPGIGVLRIDGAHGVRDGRDALSIAIER